MLKPLLYFLIGFCLLFVACKKEEKKVPVKSPEEQNYFSLSGGVLWLSKNYFSYVPSYNGTLYSSIAFFFEAPLKVKGDSVGFSSNIGTVTINDREMSRDVFGPNGFMYKNNGNITNLPMDFSIKSETGNNILFYRDYGDRFPNFSNYPDIPNHIDKKAGFTFTLNNLVNTASVTAAFYGTRIVRTFTTNVIYFSPATLDSLSATSYLIFTIYLDAGKSFDYYLQGKKYECTYYSYYDYRGISMY